VTKRCDLPVAAGWTFPHNLKEAALNYSLLKFISDESGATAIRLIAAGIALAIIAVVNGLGSNLNTMLSSINTSLK
jgi:pilus assembly protein Flp/PilA